MLCAVVVASVIALNPDHHWRRIEVVGFEKPFHLLERISVDDERTGGIVWPGARGLAAYLSMHRELVAGLDVLEVGCGPGLVSLAARAAGAKSVLATDFDDDALDRVAQASEGVVRTARFDLFGAAKLPPCDTLLAADCVYTPELADAMRRRAIEAATRGTRVVVADSQRWRWDTFAAGDQVAKLGEETRDIRSLSTRGVPVNLFVSWEG
ncbi:hypothetical protein CTAYLR_003927 [Chrysophaeum taylorii]|uniref:Methyltransferase domain-containing protein n=1 Tax=Chrysophaeum taylorii TaxID=2483200 RepID=A0AAD7XGN0_9STRA|nr:hypothetical protein CTAYLR_003927 [Chrysophaeum taylorii]